MALTERQRRNLYEQAEAAMGTEAADTLMAHLPPVGWADVATKQDLAILGAESRTEMADLRTEIKDAELRISETLRHELGDLRGSMDRRFRWLFGAVATVFGTLISAIGVAAAIAADVTRLF